MGRHIHRRDTPDGPRYRLWSTNSDSYVGKPMTRAQMIARLMRMEIIDARRRTDERMETADACGSSNGEARDVAGPWDRERCGECSGFHHEFQEAYGGNCSTCGEPREFISHEPACTAGGE